MSTNNLIDNILLIARNNNIGESEKLSRHQVQLWLMYYRAMLIKQEIDKDKDRNEINNLYITTIEPIHLNAEETIGGNIVYKGDTELPKLIDFNNRSGVIAVHDMYGNIIQIGTASRSKYQKYAKYACKDYIAYVKGNNVYVEGDNNQLEYISIDVIAEDPTDVECFNPDAEFPAPAAMIPTIVSLILSRELNIQVAMPSDNTNNSNDDTQNRVSKPQRVKAE